MLRRKQKKVKLKTVEERPEHADVVVRLGKGKEEEDTSPPVRIGPAKPVVAPSAASDATPREFRSHQPDIDALIDKPFANTSDENAELSWGEEAYIRRHRPWGWLLLAGLCIAGFVVWSLLSLKESGQVRESIRVQAHQAVSDEASEQREAEMLVRGMESAIRAYFTAATIESRLRWVRFPARVEPLMREYEKTHPVTPSPVHMIRVMQPLSIENSTNFWMASVVLASGNRHELVIEATDAGPQIDWETMVCHQPMPWDEFATRRPVGKSMDFRVHARPDTFYSHEFHDETQWACYRLSAPDAEQVVFGYVRRSSDTEAAIAPLTTGVRPASLILRLQIPPGLKSPMGVVIESIRSPRWLYLTAPDEEI